MNELTINIIIGALSFAFGITWKFSLTRARRFLKKGYKEARIEFESDLKEYKKNTRRKYKQQLREFKKELQRLEEIHRSEKNAIQKTANSAIKTANFKESQYNILNEQMIKNMAYNDYKESIREKQIDSAMTTIAQLKVTKETVKENHSITESKANKSRLKIANFNKK